MGTDDSLRTLRQQYENIAEQLNWIEQYSGELKEGDLHDSFVLTCTVITGDLVKVSKKVRKLADIIWYGVPAARKTKSQPSSGKFR